MEKKSIVFLVSDNGSTDNIIMLNWNDMTPDERDRFIYLTLSEDALKAVTLIMRRKHGSAVSTETIMKFAFKVAKNRILPAHLKH